MSTEAINTRYTILAEEACCLSCGGAIDHSNAQPGEVCVDLGSGRGTDVMRLSEEVGDKGYVYGIDLSDGMIEKSRKLAQKLGAVNVEFKQTQLESLPIDDNHVDLVISNCTINHANDKQKVWNEVYRILKKGGRFIVSDIYSTAPVPEKYRSDPEAIAQCWAGAVTRDVYLKQLEQAGFKTIDIIEQSKPYPKGEIEVSSFTIRGLKPKGCCNS